MTEEVPVPQPEELQPDPDRAARVKEILEVYRSSVLVYCDESWTEVVAWLIADVRHFCHQEQVDYHDAERRSYQYYLEEMARYWEERKRLPARLPERANAPPV